MKKGKKIKHNLLKLSNSNKLRAFHLFNHIVLVYGALHGEWWMWVIGFIIWNFIGTFGISIGYHRLLAHKSFTTKPLATYLTSIIGCLATGGSPISWVGSHRLHHFNPDYELDPHSPTNNGFLKTYFHFWKPFIIPRKIISDLLSSRYQKFLHRWYFFILLAWGSILYSIDPLVGIFAYSLPSTFAFHAFAMINTLCHRYGYQSYETNDFSTNNWLVNIFSCGEGWHNNHHKFPSSYRIGIKRNEFDISARVIELFFLKKTNR